MIRMDVTVNVNYIKKGKYMDYYKRDTSDKTKIMLMGDIDDVKDRLDGLHTLVNSFYWDKVLNGYNLPDDDHAKFELCASVFPLIIDTLSNSVTTLEVISTDMDIHLEDKTTILEKKEGLEYEEK